MLQNPVSVHTERKDIEYQDKEKLYLEQQETLQREEIQNFFLTPGIWLWLDKTPVDYTNWREGQPDSGSYALMSPTDGRWTTGNRWYDRGYICKTPKSEIVILILTLN